MKTEELKKTIFEAERFLERAKGLIKEQEGYSILWHPTEVASVKRSSMDLTRQLAKLRKRND